jgi:FlaG/FlaF family flagellin (archaellin)
MTVAIAGLMYAWLSGMFSSLTQSTSNQINQVTQVTSFSISDMYVSNGNIYAVIYNGGNIPINSNALNIIAQEYYASNSTYDGNTDTCTATVTSGQSPIPSGQQATLSLSCSGPVNIVNDWNTGNYYYVFTFTYNGISVEAKLPVQ